jgi:hypothetical protein
MFLERKIHHGEISASCRRSLVCYLYPAKDCYHVLKAAYGISSLCKKDARRGQRYSWTRHAFAWHLHDGGRQSVKRQDRQRR